MRAITIALVLLLLAGCKPPGLAGKSDRNRLNRIAAVYERGDFTAAISQLREYLGKHPKDDLAWTILGNAYENTDQIDEAWQAYHEALAINPRCFQAIVGQGVIHRTRGDYDQAMAAYERALQIQPDYAQAHSSMTMIALKRGDFARALQYAKRGYAEDKTDPVIAANLAVAYHYSGDAVNRDRLTKVAERLGYQKLDVLKQIYSGELTVLD